MADSQENTELYDKAQECLVACLLADSSFVPQALEQVREEFFLIPQYGVLFSSIAHLARSGQVVSQFSVAKNLEERGLLATAGGIETIAKLTDDGENLLLDGPISQYCQILRDYAIKHAVKEDVKEMIDDLNPDSGVNSVEVIGKIRSIVDERQFDMVQTSTASDMTDLTSEYLDRMAQRRENAKKNGNGILGVPTSLPTLNDLTSGWRPGQLITVVARTGVGKSVFAINQAVSAAQAGQTVLIMNLEMSREEIEDRIVASVTGLYLNSLQKGEIYNQELLDEGLRELANMKIVIDTTPKVTVDMVRARAMRQAQSEDGLDLLIVDYVQLMKSSHYISNREQEVASFSRDLKVLAKDLGVPLITAAQANRAKDKEHAAEAPQINEIRESNAIAQDSDIIIILHRVPTEDVGEKMTQVIIAKHRNGEVGKKILCHSNLHCALLREAEEDQDMSNVDDELADVEPWADFQEFDASDYESMMDDIPGGEGPNQFNEEEAPIW